MSLQQPPQAILFDLDGTLIDTAQDLISALNSLTATVVPLNLATRAAAGKGCKGLLKTGLNIEEQDSRYQQFSAEFFAYYQDHLLDNSQLFPGIALVLDYLDQKNIPWGIVTNKPARYTQPILDGLNLSARAKCIISGDSLQTRKPDPEPLLHACRILNQPAHQCLYVGDTETDVLASKAAGMPSLIALYGYIDEAENPHTWAAEGYIQQAEDILHWV